MSGQPEENHYHASAGTQPKKKAGGKGTRRDMSRHAHASERGFQITKK
jgi:hypothetical protein